MVGFLANSLVITGAAILVGSLMPARQLLIQLPRGGVRTRWYIMTILSVLFIAGYIEYAVALWNRALDFADLIVPGVFFFGACFVWLSCTLSLQAVNDIRRVTFLEQESITDPLSGMYNRRYLDRRLEEELVKAQRYHLPLSILLIDIDQFKHLNDTFGHQAGDRVLSCLGRLVLDTLRASDIAARYGGDEFLIIAPNTALSQASALAERLRSQVEAHPVELSGDHGKQQLVRVTVCIGVAGCARKTECLENLVQAADEALYCAKAAGRNRVVA